MIKKLVYGSDDLDLTTVDMDDFVACIAELDKVMSDKDFDGRDYKQSVRELWDSNVEHHSF